MTLQVKQEHTMNTKQLTGFLHLCDTKSYTRAAKAMHASPSALSRIIQRLEEDIGQPLFIRTNKAVTLTPAGKTLLPVAREILQLWHTTKANINEHASLLGGKLTLFCSVTASYSHLPELLARFRQQYPNIELQLLTGDPAQAEEKVQDNSADIAIAAKPKYLSSSLVFQPIDTVSLSVIAPAMASSGIDLQAIDWQHIPLILPEAGTARELADQWLASKGIEANVYAQIAGHEAIVSMVALGCGIGVAPDVVIDNSPVKDKVERLRQEIVQPLELGLCCKTSRAKEPLLNALLDTMR